MRRTWHSVGAQRCIYKGASIQSFVRGSIMNHGVLLSGEQGFKGAILQYNLEVIVVYNFLHCT